MLPRTLKIHWLLLALLVVFVMAGSYAARLSVSTVVAPLALTAGESISFSVFRLFPDTVRLMLEFKSAGGHRRPELGEFQSRREAGYIEFNSPGEPVLISVIGPTSTAVYEALPAGSFGAGQIGRELVVRETDGNSKRFNWPPNNAARPILPTGTSTVTITVMDVGHSLSGEKVSLILKPPLSFKSHMPGYGFLWWFLFWPVLAGIISVYACVVAWQTLKSRRAQVSGEI
jgi:hypothetical protein